MNKGKGGRTRWVFGDERSDEQRAEDLRKVKAAFQKGDLEQEDDRIETRAKQRERTRRLADEVTTEINELRAEKAQDGKDTRAIEVVAARKGMSVKRAEQLYMGPDPDEKPKPEAGVSEILCASRLV